MSKYREGLFLIGIFLIGLLAIFPYGAHLDQSSEQEILYSNVKMYLGYFGAEESGLYRRLEADGIIDIADSIERDHGMAAYYPMFWIFYINQIFPFWGNIIWHVYIYLLVFGGVLALYCLLREMFDSFRIAAFTTAVFFFTPRMFAESHYNNKDMVLLSIALCIFYFGWKLRNEQSWRHVAAFSLIVSLAANMKIIGIWTGGIMGLYIFFALICVRQFNRGILGKALACLVLTGCFYTVLTPACWKGVWPFISYLIESAKNFRWNSWFLFDGTMYHKTMTGIPRRYLPIMILFTVPVGVLLLSLTGLLEMLLRLAKKPAEFMGNTGYSCMTVLAGMVPLGYAVLSGTPVYNGWRHFYFCYASMIMPISYAVSFLMRMAERYKKTFWADFALTAYLLLLAGGIAVNYPHEYAYYNFLAGRGIESRYELDYWDMSFKQAYGMILKSTDEEIVKIGTVSNPSFWGLEEQLYALQSEQQKRIVLCERWQDAQYLIINPMYMYLYGPDDYGRIKQNYRLAGSIRSYGSVICEIYQK